MSAQTGGPSLRRAARTALAVILVAVLVRRLRIAAGMRRGDQAVIDAKRKRNKRFANKVVTRFGRAGRPHSIFAVIENTGRRSGRRYATPVRVVEEAGGFIVPLTYDLWVAHQLVRQPQGRPGASYAGRAAPFRSATRPSSPPARPRTGSHPRRDSCSGSTAPIKACGSTT
jgi:hypothetical protein